METPTSFKYRAFLSYSHSDIGWAKWLHERLEAFRFDKDLIGRQTPVGAVRSRHPERPVIPVIVEGTTPNNLPSSLRFEIAADGIVTDRPITILGPDLRDSADGKTLGLAKAIAGLTGLGADDVFRRAKRANRRWTLIWAGVTGFSLLLAVWASGSTFVAKYAFEFGYWNNDRFYRGAVEVCNCEKLKRCVIGSNKISASVGHRRVTRVDANVAKSKRCIGRLQAWMINHPDNAAPQTLE